MNCIPVGTYSGAILILIKIRENGNENIIKYLVEHGADINKEISYGEVPLHKASKYYIINKLFKRKNKPAIDIIIANFIYSRSRLEANDKGMD
ncbi:hypothetical protein H8356DRAFT_1357427 [Neocallimastix lanati (nom. inval.)]|nr:hypothetical protein H8356DRAFT_1357427 [Neocallimastix sp. JGI-2020a]